MVTLRNETGHVLSFTLDNTGSLVDLRVDGMSTGETARFANGIPPHTHYIDLPPAVRAAARGRRVCGYNPNCQVCFCDDDGTVTCEAYC
jgi:hypothetical protein